MTGLTANPLLLHFTVALKIAGVLMKPIKEEWDEALEVSLQHDLEIAKSKGLQAVKNWVFSYGIKTNMRIEVISTISANKMLQGEFKSLKSLFDHSSTNQYNSNDFVTILYKEIDHGSEKGRINIIESIFLNQY